MYAVAHYTVTSIDLATAPEDGPTPIPSVCFSDFPSPPGFSSSGGGEFSIEALGAMVWAPIGDNTVIIVRNTDSPTTTSRLTTNPTAEPGQVVRPPAEPSSGGQNGNPISRPGNGVPANSGPASPTRTSGADVGPFDIQNIPFGDDDDGSDPQNGSSNGDGSPGSAAPNGGNRKSGSPGSNRQGHSPNNPDATIQIVSGTVRVINPTAPLSSGKSGAQNGTTVFQFSTTEAEYFVASFLPTLLAVIFAIPWKIIHHNVISLEPFHRMTTRNALSMGTAIRLAYDGPIGYFMPVTSAWYGDWSIAISSFLEYASAFIPPLMADSVQMRLVGPCTEFDSRGCAAVVHTVPEVLRTLQAILACMGIAIVALLLVLRNRNFGVKNDPRNIFGVAALLQQLHTRQVLNQAFEQKIPLSINEVQRTLHDRRFRLGLYPGDDSPEKYGISVDDPVTSDEEDEIAESVLASQLAAPVRIPILRLSLLLSTFIVFLLGFTALIYYYFLTFHDTPFERFMDSGKFGGRFLFACLGVFIGFVWSSVFSG
jgi:hypothetical protein